MSMLKPIPKKQRDEMAQDIYYHQCARANALNDHVCEPDPMRGKLVEWEHAMYYAGQRINDRWAIVPICWLVHRGGKLNKEINQWLALNQATAEDLAKYPKAKFQELKDRLNAKYGLPSLSTEKAPF